MSSWGPLQAVFSIHAAVEDMWTRSQIGVIAVVPTRILSPVDNLLMCVEKHSAVETGGRCFMRQALICYSELATKIGPADAIHQLVGW